MTVLIDLLLAVLFEFNDARVCHPTPTADPNLDRCQ